MGYNRRKILKLYALAGTSLAMSPTLPSWYNSKNMLTRTVASSGESLPVVGLGTWQTFDAGMSDTQELQNLKQVLVEMNSLGGTVIDSSPMYGSSESVVGKLTSDMAKQDAFFYTSKVWTSGKQAGIDQMNAYLKKCNARPWISCRFITL